MSRRRAPPGSAPCRYPGIGRCGLKCMSGFDEVDSAVEIEHLDAAQPCRRVPHVRYRIKSHLPSSLDVGENSGCGPGGEGHGATTVGSGRVISDFRRSLARRPWNMWSQAGLQGCFHLRKLPRLDTVGRIQMSHEDWRHIVVSMQLSRKGLKLRSCHRASNPW